MSPPTPASTPRSVLSGLLGFIALSAVAGVLVTVGVAPAIAVLGVGARSSITLFDSLPEYLAIDRLAEPTQIYAKRDGQDVLLARFYAQNRQPLTDSEIPKVVRDAALAAEDPRFYTHGGVDLRGTMRGFISTYLLKGSTQGGSSITQQYVKNVLLQKCEAMPQKSTADRRTYLSCVEDATGTKTDRKLREMRYAIGLEKKYSKKQILGGYLNISGFGGSVYGIQAAARYYFSVDAKDLSAAQAASLLAIVNAPTSMKLDQPANSKNGAADGYATNRARRDYILGKMLKAGSLTPAQAREAIASPVTPQITPSERGCQTAGNAAFFCDYVRRIATRDPAFGANADERAANFIRGGYRIHSTLDLTMQDAAHSAVASRVPANSSRGDLGAASVGVQPGTGRVLFMAQSRAFSQDPEVLHTNPGTTAVNWSTDADYGGSTGFQVGSTYKIFTLAEWLREGHGLYETVDANVRTYNLSRFTDTCESRTGTWRPTNDAPGEEGRRTVMQATTQSINTAYVAMASKLDLCGITKTAKSFLVHRADGDPLLTVPSSVLGTNEIAPLSMATAFAAVANGGVACSPIAIDSITRSDGTEVTAPASTCTRAVSPDIAAQMAVALQQVVTSGTAAASRTGDGIPVLGKTGTTDEAEQIWLVESSTKVATAFWSGNVTGHVSLRSFSLAGMRADQVRHAAVRDIMRAANAAYGGEAFATVARRAGRDGTPKDSRSNGIPVATPPPDPGQSAAPDVGSTRPPEPEPARTPDAG